MLKRECRIDEEPSAHFKNNPSLARPDALLKPTCDERDWRNASLEEGVSLAIL